MLKGKRGEVSTTVIIVLAVLVVLFVGLLFTFQGKEISGKKIVAGLERQTETQKCEELSGAQRDSCYYTLSINAGDTTICNNIADAKVKQACLGECAIITNQNEKDECYAKLALAKEDPTICDNILNEQKRKICVMIIDLKR